MPNATTLPAVSIPSGGFARTPTALKGSLPPARSVPGKVRLVKDLLRPGRWPIGVDAGGNVQFWDVTAATLVDIARVFQKQKAEGQTRPLQWGHVDPSTGNANADPRNVVDYWDCLIVSGQTLWGVIYVTNEDAAMLTSVNRPISVAVDYAGNVLTPGSVAPMKNALLHVALVDQGAMPGQGPFVQMAMPRSTARPKQISRLEQVRLLRNRMKRERN